MSNTDDKVINTTDEIMKMIGDGMEKYHPENPLTGEELYMVSAMVCVKLIGAVEACGVAPAEITMKAIKAGLSVQETH